MDTKFYPEPIAGAFILNSKGELFLLKSKKWSNLYVVPGGHIEIGESAIDALNREVKEETGMEVFDPEFLTYWDFIEDKEFVKKKHFIFLNFLVKTNSEKVTLNEEAEDYIWVKPNDALNLPLQKQTRLTIEKFIVKK